MPSFDFDFVVRFINITLMDIALSGDNVIVIGMAAAALPPAGRKWALIFGGTLAIALRIVLTSIATILTLIPYLSAIGGIVLIWVVYRLVGLDASPDSAEETRTANSLRQAVILILTADLMMSIDNVIAIAGSAHGSIPLLIAGLLISMPLLMMTGGFISTLIDKARWLVFLGAAAISYTAVRMVFEDGAVEARFAIPAPIQSGVSLAAAIVLPGAIYLVARAKKRMRPAAPPRSPGAS